MDFRIKCLGCGRQVLLPRPKFEKSVKSIVKKQGEEERTVLGAKTRAVPLFSPVVGASSSFLPLPEKKKKA